jgi:predicted nuclease of restriction endonuclease-like (RecB) superfamily
MGRRRHYLGHQVRILDTVKDAKQMEWYIPEGPQCGWRTNVLVHQIESELFDRQAHPATNFDRTAPFPQSDLARS